jgi:hypothetical protein
MLDDI